MKVQELVTLVPWTFVAQILNLFIQAYLIKRFLLKPVQKVLDERRAKADASIAEAQKAKEEAVTMKEDYEKSIAGAKNTANEILTSAQKTAQAQSDQILQEAAAQAAAIKAKASADIEQEKKKALADIKNEIGDMAVGIAGKVIEREVNEDDHKKLIDEFIENVGEAS